MKMNVKDVFLIAKLTKSKNSTFVLLGDKEFKGNYGVFVEEEQAKDLEVLDKVEVELTLTINTTRVERNGKGEFLNIVSGVRVHSLKKI